jgi:hypothetical protein
VYNGFQFAGNSYGEEKKTNAFDNKYSEFNLNTQSYSDPLISQLKPYASYTTNNILYKPSSEATYSGEKYGKPEYLTGL